MCIGVTRRASKRLVALAKTLPLIVTYRPEFAPPWIGQPHVAALTINRLGDWEIAAMIDLVTGNKPLPASIRLDIIERTDGIPLFVEEMTKAVLEAESHSDATATVPPSALAVPASLHASLMARLDRLGSAKDVAQIGAAIGREFILCWLLIPQPEADLRSALDRLIDAGLLFRQGVPPHATYLFKHALVQDAAYGTLLREPRRALHARIAETLEGQFTDIAESQPELLARHYTEAGLIEKAVSFWRTAGQRSLARSALLEGAQQIKRALDQIATLPATPDLHGEEIKLLVAFANALTLTGNFVDGKDHYDRALTIYEPAEHRPLTTRSGRDIGVALLASRSGCAWLLGYPAAARSDADQALKEAREIKHATTLLHALWRAVIITSSAEITPLQMRRSTSFSVWQTKEEHRTGKHLGPPSGVGFLPRPEKPRMRFGRSPWGSPHFGQWSEQLFMNRITCSIWQWLMRILASFTMLGVALTTR